MTFKRRRHSAPFFQWINLFFGLLLAFSSCAQSETQFVDQSVIAFEMKPVVCIAQYMGQACNMVVALNWQLKSVESLCLLQQEIEVKCWHQTEKFAAKIEVNMQQSSLFQLVRKSDNFVLAQQQITINYLNKYRRRLKPQWSIF
jgi:hypothetical protein